MADNNLDYENYLLNPSQDPALSPMQPGQELPLAEPLPMEQQESIMPGITTAQAIQGADQLQAEQQQLAQPEVQQAVSAEAPQLPASQDLTVEKALGDMPGYQQAEQAIAFQQQAEQGLAAAQAKTYESGADLEAKAMQTYQRDLNTLNKERDALVADIKASHIKPNQYLENLSADSKISTAIGLILGGMAGRDGNNPVMDFLNKQIDRDLKAQLAGLENKQNLLGALDRQFGNRQAAENMFLAMRKGLIADQINTAVAKSKDPMAIAAGHKASSDLMRSSMSDVIKTQQQVAMLRGQGTADQNADPELLVPHMVPPEKQKDVFESIARAKTARKIEGEIMDLFKTADKENTLMGRTGRLGYAPPSVAAIESLIMPLVRDAAGRVSEMELATVNKLIPLPGDGSDTVQQKKKGLEQFMRAKQEEYAVLPKAYRIDLDKFKSTSGDKSLQYPKAYIDWAKANPDRPEAKAILNRIR
jgi:hypothetical protein